MCACALLWASCFPCSPLLVGHLSPSAQFPGGDCYSFSWKGERCDRCEDALVRSSFNCPCCQVSSAVFNILQLSVRWYLTCRRHPRSSPPRSGPYSGVPSSECLAFSPHLGATLKGIVAPDHLVGMTLPLDSFYPILLPPSLFHRCRSHGHSFRNICKLIPKLEPLPGKPSLRQKTIIYLWIVDWIMLFSCLKYLWDEVQTP